MNRVDLLNRLWEAALSAKTNRGEYGFLEDAARYIAHLENALLDCVEASRFTGTEDSIPSIVLAAFKEWEKNESP